MTLTCNHTTEPSGDSTLHYWEIRGPHGAVSLSAVQMTAEATAVVARIARDLPSVDPVIAVDAGMILDVVQSHTVTHDTQFGCSRHQTCEASAYATRVALPVWEDVRAAVVTDNAVYEQLMALFAVEFGEVST